jgi:Stress responsive A/B Barrel Domain
VVRQRTVLAIATRRAPRAAAGKPRAAERPGKVRLETRAGEGQTPMIAHVVLFKPRRDLSAEDRSVFGDAILRAQREIPGIRRFSVGRRVLKEASYAQAMPEDFSYAAIIEFDDLAALQTYLNHPVHEPLGAWFWKTSEATLVYDYELTDASNVSEILG